MVRRQIEPYRGARSQAACQRDPAADLLDHGAYNVHSDATAGNIRNFGRGRKARRKHQIDDLLVCQRREFIGRHQALLRGLPPHHRRVNTTAIIGHLNQEPVADPGCLDRDRRGLGFSGRLPLPGAFDTVINGVAHQMHQGFEQAIHHSLVGFRGFTACRQLNVLAELARHIANEAVERSEHLRYRYHPQLQDGAV